MAAPSAVRSAEDRVTRRVEPSSKVRLTSAKRRRLGCGPPNGRAHRPHQAVPLGQRSAGPLRQPLRCQGFGASTPQWVLSVSWSRGSALGIGPSSRDHRRAPIPRRHNMLPRGRRDMGAAASHGDSSCSKHLHRERRWPSTAGRGRSRGERSRTDRRGDGVRSGSAGCASARSRCLRRSRGHRDGEHRRCRGHGGRWGVMWLRGDRDGCEHLRRRHCSGAVAALSPPRERGWLVGDDVVAAAGCDLVERDGEQLGELEVRPVDDRAECFPRHQ